MSLLTRTLRLRLTGDDVYGVKRTVCRALDANDHGQRLKELESKSDKTKRLYGAFFVKDVNKLRKQLGFKQTSIVDQNLWATMVRLGYPDAFTIQLMNSYIDAHPPSSLIFPVPLGQQAHLCQGLHPTAGLADNWAIDFCSPPGTTIVAVEAGTIAKLSGHSPNNDTWDTQGVFGWSVHFRTTAGYRYFVTHLGWRLPTLKVGIKVEAGDTLGRVGDQKFRPDHVHYGVTSPISEADAKKRITAVSKAPRID